MLRRLIQWVQGGIVTLDIKFNHPELYRALTRPYDMQKEWDSFIEAERPGDKHSPNVLAVRGLDGSVYPDKTVCGWDGKPWPCPDAGAGT